MELKPITINELLAKNVRLWPEETAVIFMDARYTWKEIDSITDALASYYLECGIKTGTHVGIFSTNSINWVCVFLALAKIGAVSVLFNFNLSVKELIHVVNYSRIEYLCYGEGMKDVDFLPMIEKIKEEKIWRLRQFIAIGRNKRGKWYSVSEIPYRFQKTDERLLDIKQKVTSDHTLSMIFTSGTTAGPKGVLLTQFQMLNVAREAVEAMRWTQKDRMCLALALFHCFGLSTGLLSSLITGGSICLLPSFRSQIVLGTIEKERCTVLNGVPSMFLAIMNNPKFREYNISSLYSGIIAGSGIRRQDYYRVKEAFGYHCLQQSYGQTEASPSITFSGYDDAIELKAVSVGRVIPNVSLRVAHQRDGQMLPAGRKGEIQIRGFNVMKQGYYHMAAETKKAFTWDGWLRTGDLGYLDEKGNLFITGRIKDVIIRCGENISPKEVEDAILEYPHVKDVVVFGQEDDVVQEEVAACLICGEGYREDELLQYLSRRLAKYKIPKYLYLFQKFPINSNGKLNKKSLLEEAGKMKKIKEEP